MVHRMMPRTFSTQFSAHPGKFNSTSIFYNQSYNSRMRKCFTFLILRIRHGLPGSAICAYKMSDVADSFRGPFKEKKKGEGFWTTAKDIPHPHPASVSYFKELKN